MKLATYLLIFLSIWSQFDDSLLAPLPTSPTAPLIDDDDEYLPAEQGERGEQSSPLRSPALAVLDPKAGTFPPTCLGRGVPSGANLSGPFGPSSLYVFMSLQR